ncbi:MAG: HAMP domain-containing histidine kinase [Clostridia bacterium]|nr:HAMP domain-containing histidine kinase [Clostridia bacterium]
MEEKQKLGFFSKNKIKRKSLYRYILLSFIIILIIMFLCSSLYFRYARYYLIDILNQHGVDLSPIDKSRVVDGVIGAVLETITFAAIIGLVLVIVVFKHVIGPIRKMSDATKKVAKGDFNVQIENKKIRKDEIGTLTENFNMMVRELESNEYLSKEFMNNVSHEFKTPIASIQGFANLLKDKDLSEKDKEEYIDIIIEESGRLANLSNNIQQLSKLENKKGLIQKQKVAIDEQIRKCIIILNNKLEEKNIEIGMDEDKDVFLNVNEDMMHQVWINLINNAIKYTDDNGRIDIIIDEFKDRVVVEVKDTGRGIKEENVDKIFEKFYQEDSSHNSEGNGLGLAIVKKIVELHKGTIEVKSKIGDGSSFIVTIPKDEDKLEN